MVTWRRELLPPCVKRESLSYRLMHLITDRLFKICFDGALDFIESRMDSTDNKYVERFYEDLMEKVVGCVKDRCLEEDEMRKLEESLKKESLLLDEWIENKDR